MLSLNKNALTGPIPSTIGNMTSLKGIWLHNNTLNGTLPESLGNLISLQSLGLGSNFLSGSIPEFLGNFVDLVLMDLNDNGMSGSIPSSFQSLTKMIYMDLGSNFLSGPIPEFLGNFVDSTILNLQNNNFNGTIPESFSKLTNLWDLYFDRTGVTGALPSMLGYLTGLSSLRVDQTKLKGVIPPTLGYLTNLVSLDISGTALTCPPARSSCVITQDVTSAFCATCFAFCSTCVMKPPSAANTSPQMQVLLDLQQEWGQTFKGWVAGGNCSLAEHVTCDAKGMITKIDLNEHSLTGTIPPSISQLASLRHLNLHQTGLTGSIPRTLASLSNLTSLDLRENNLTGWIPAGIDGLLNLRYLGLNTNRLTSSIPPAICNITGLTTLDLCYNALSQSIPECIGNLINLDGLYLFNNRLSGSIPGSMSKLVKLTHLDFTLNKFTGELPPTLGRLTRLYALDITNTTITCPRDKSSCVVPQTQSSAFCKACPTFCSTCITEPPSPTPSSPSPPPPTNSTTPSSPGSVPSPPSSPSPAPPSISSPSPAPSPVPTPSPPPPTTSTASQPAAAPSQSGGGMSTAAIAGIAAAAVVLGLALLLLGVMFWRRRRTEAAAASGYAGTNGEGKNLAAESALQDTHHNEDGPEAQAGVGWAAAAAAAAAAAGGRDDPGAVVDVEAARPDVCREYSLVDMEKATEEWAEKNRLGSGSFGDVYKGVSPYDRNKAWAVKRAQVLSNDFQIEVKEMASKHHPHLVRLLGYCLDFNPATRKMEQILVYELMHNNDLETWVGPGVANPLSLRQRLDVLIGVAKGLQYLHEFGIVHRDMKPANILLDAKMQAKIADFGLVKLSGGTAMGTTVAATRVMGTPGFVDPAYYKSHKATPAADVYSFGVVMLVVITARKAVHVTEDTHTNLRKWVAPLVESNAVSTFKDPCLEAPDDLVLRLACLALSCTGMPTASRPSISQVLVDLVKMREDAFGAQANRVASRIDEEIDASFQADFDAEIARVKSMGVSGSSSGSV
ncbi:hypothetical protein CLOM_g965 [Closterium sp. NIES-68]|nr:hypothetical protein CLOM_g965 [Closterium sp. NIES-68]